MELALQSKTEIYREHLDELAETLALFDIHLKPYKDSSLPLFRKLTSAQQDSISFCLKAYAGALKAEYSSGTDFSDEKFVWQFLFRIGVMPPEDLIGIVKDQKYIQIYNRDCLQIFRSLKCYERCSFTLEQLTTRTWSDLWDRDNIFYYAMFGLAATALKFLKFTNLKLDFPYHRVSEIDSANDFEFDYRIKSLTTLTRQGKVYAALLIEDWKY